MRLDDETMNVSNGSEGYLSSLGILPVTERFRRTRFGTWRTLRSLTRIEIAFTFIGLLLILASIVVTGIRIFQLYAIPQSENNNKFSDITYAFLLLLNLFYCKIYLIRGVFAERAFELIAYATAALIVTAYTVANFTLSPLDGPTGQNSGKKLRLGLVLAFGPVTAMGAAYFAYEYYQSNRLIFNVLESADKNLKRMCKRSYACESLIHFSSQFQLSTLLLCFAVDTLDTDNSVFISGTIIILIWFLFGIFSLSYENSKLAIVFIILSLSAPTYLGYIVYQIIEYLASEHAKNSQQTEKLISGVITFGLGSIIVQFIMIVLFLYIMLKDFGRGLKERLAEGRRIHANLMNAPNNGSPRRANRAPDEFDNGYITFVDS